MTLHCHGDKAGREAGERVRHAIEAADRECRVEWYAVGANPASAVADWLAERSGTREASGEARDAWVDLLREAT